MSQLSMYLSYLLRHHPEEIHLHMDKHGYVKTDELIENINQLSDYSIDLELLKDIEKKDKKQRYKFKDDYTYIKANQGHSLDFVEVELHSQIPPDYLYHGTHLDAYELIKECGYISKMERHAVHMHANINSAKASAKRWRRKSVILKINAKRMYEDGIELGVSDNDVWCAPKVLCQYIEDVIVV